MHWSYLPPLLVYFAAGVSGLTSIVGTFFIKEYLGVSAAFLASVAFWAGIPWAAKMPLGHLVDLIWRWKGSLVVLGAALIALSIGIMYGLIAHTQAMTQLLSVEAWFVLSALLAPSGYVVQDVVADAMTVEAVATTDWHGNPYSEEKVKIKHTTMQTLGRFSIVSGLVLVAGLNIVMFSGVETMSQEQKREIYAQIYLMALAIPVISVTRFSIGAALISPPPTWAQFRYRRLMHRRAFDQLPTAARIGLGSTASTWPDRGRSAGATSRHRSRIPRFSPAPSRLAHSRVAPAYRPDRSPRVVP